LSQEWQQVHLRQKKSLLDRILGPAPNDRNADNCITSTPFRVWYFADFGIQ